MTKAELTGPGAAAFWLATLRGTDNTPKRDFLTLVDAAGRLRCQPDALLDQGLSGALALYAPVLHEGLYVWPVTERGIPHDRLLGNRDGAMPIFQARLNYGDYAMLTPTDLKKIKIEQAVKPGGYICPERVLHYLEEWEASQHEEHAAPLLNRMRRLANQVAWVPAFLPESEVGVIRPEMLRVDGNDLPGLNAQRAESAVASVVYHAVDHDPSPSLQGIDALSITSESASGLKKRERQFQAIEAAADACSYPRKQIPDGGKQAIMRWCQENRPKLFTSSAYTFNDIWQDALDAKRVRMANHKRYAGKD